MFKISRLALLARNDSVRLVYHFVNINLQVAALDEIVEGMLTKGIIICPEIAQVADILSQRAVILGLRRIQVSHARISFAETVHGQFISFRGDEHGFS